MLATYLLMILFLVETWGIWCVFYYFFCLCWVSMRSVKFSFAAIPHEVNQSSRSPYPIGQKFAELNRLEIKKYNLSEKNLGFFFYGFMQNGFNLWKPSKFPTPSIGAASRIRFFGIFAKKIISEHLKNRTSLIFWVHVNFVCLLKR